MIGNDPSGARYCFGNRPAERLPHHFREDIRILRRGSMVSDRLENGPQSLELGITQKVRQHPTRLPSGIRLGITSSTSLG